MKVVVPYILFLWLMYSCNAKHQSQKDSDPINEQIYLPPSTAYKFPELRTPPGFYLDSISVYDSVLKAQYDAYFLQSDLPQMEEFNKSVSAGMRKQIEIERAWLEPDERDNSAEPVFTCYLKPVAYYFNKQIISITHIADTYSQGGAHHNYSWYTFNYDLKENKPIWFGDIFNLPRRKDSANFVKFVKRFMLEDCWDWNMPFDSVDFSFTDKGIFINPEQSWACVLNRSLLPEDSLKQYINDNWYNRKK